MNGVIGFVISGLEWDFGACLAVRPVVEETIGERAAETLMEKDEQEHHFNTLVAGCSTLPSIWPFRWPAMEIVAGVHRGDGQELCYWLDGNLPHRRQGPRLL